MIYACDKCHFIFERVGKVDACPDCGKPAVREASKKEQAEYRMIRQEMNKPEGNKK